MTFRPIASSISMLMTIH